MPRIAREKTIKKEENIYIKEKENEKTSSRKKENNISTSTKKNTKNTTVTKVNKQEKILKKNKLNTISNENETSSKSKTSIKKIASNKLENKKTTSNKNSSTKATAKKETSVKVDTKKNTAPKKKTSVKADTPKSTSSKKETSVKADTQKSTSPKKETSVKADTPKSTASKKETSIKANAKKSTAPKKETSIKAGTKKSTVLNKTVSTSTKSKKASNLLKTETKSNVKILEYYDLPYKYGHTLIKLLAQTPKTLFVYWEISDIDVENFKNNYGEDFFKITKPILIIHNLTLNETYEVEINDFANCWYLDITHPDCKYDVELARKFIKNNKENKINDYLYITKSNDLISPNNHILFEKLGQFVTFRNVNTNEKIISNIKSYDFLSNIYEFYKQMYNEELLNNPSSKFI